MLSSRRSPMELSGEQVEAAKDQSGIISIKKTQLLTIEIVFQEYFVFNILSFVQVFICS
jgi:hypothetical protein